MRQCRIQQNTICIFNRTCISPMTELYHITLPELEPVLLLQRFLPFIQTTLQEAYRIVPPKRAVQSAAGHLLARSIIAKRLHTQMRDISFRHGSSGKPECSGYSSVQFSISHSQNDVMCALSNAPVGVDIEHIRPLPYRAIAHRFFTQGECCALFNTPAERQLSFFYRLWTLKESYTKMRGTGLVFSLQQAGCILPADKSGTMHCNIPLEISNGISAYYAQGYTESSAVYSVCMQDSEALSVTILPFYQWLNALPEAL